MTVYEKIKCLSEEDMAEFLYRFANDVVNAVSEFIMPNKESIIEMLEHELD